MGLITAPKVVPNTKTHTIIGEPFTETSWINGRGGTLGAYGGTLGTHIELLRNKPIEDKE
jgi:hypothetical protein